METVAIFSLGYPLLPGAERFAVFLFSLGIDLGIDADQMNRVGSVGLATHPGGR